MCQPTTRANLVGSAPLADCGCGCGGGVRRFFSAAEEQECLESYKQQLLKEVAGVEERLDTLKGK